MRSSGRGHDMTTSKIRRKILKKIEDFYQLDLHSHSSLHLTIGQTVFAAKFFFSCLRRPVWDVVVSARPQFPSFSPCNLDGGCFHIFIYYCYNTSPCWSCFALYQVSEMYSFVENGMYHSCFNIELNVNFNILKFKFYVWYYKNKIRKRKLYLVLSVW